MGYSNDLRVRVIRVVEGGAAARAAARQFVIGDATAIRWAKRWRETGSFEAKSNKGQSRSPLKKHEEWLLGLVARDPRTMSGLRWRTWRHAAEHRVNTSAWLTESSRKPRHPIPAMIAHRDCHIAVASGGDESFLARRQTGIPVPRLHFAIVLRRPNRRRAAGGHAALDGRRA